MNVKTYTDCNIRIEKDKYKKDRNFFKNYYNMNRKKYNKKKKSKVVDCVNINNNVLSEKRNDENNTNVSAYENHPYVVIGPSKVGKTYYMVKIFEKIGMKRPIHMRTRPPNQYPNCKTSTHIKPIDKYKEAVVIFDDMLGDRNSSQIDEFFSRGRHERLSVYYNSQSFLVCQDKALEITVIA